MVCRPPQSFPEGELNAQTICDFFGSPLISDQIARGGNNYWLPSISMIPANLDIDVPNVQGRGDHVAKLLGSLEFLDHRNHPLEGMR